MGPSSDFGRIAFAALRNSGHVAAGNTISYNVLIANVGNAFSHETGIFTCPQSGSYSFSFSAEIDGSSDIHVYMTRNGHNEVLIDNHGNVTYTNLSYVWSLKLQRGDKIQMKVYSGDKLYVGSERHVHFSGHLVKAD